MRQLYLYSLLPVVSIALLLFFSALLHGQRTRGLAAYCLAVAAWSAGLLLAFLPATAGVGQRLVASGGFVVAAYLHAAFEVAGARGRAPVWIAYLVAAAITALQLIQPQLLYDPATLRAGRLFWPAMAVAAGAALLPLLQLVRARGRPSGELVGLGLAGAMGYLGAAANAVLLSYGVVLPAGLFVVLGSLLVLARVVSRRQAPGQRRLMERSLTYSVIAAVVSAGFLFGALSLVEAGPAASLLTEYRLSVFFLLVLALLAFEPLRRHLQQLLGRRLLPDRAGAAELAADLAAQEQRADQAGRLAELGAFTSAVAHEVRGPLGVLAAQLRLLERGAPPAAVAPAMREQLERAGTFVEDLLRYGRPRPLQLRRLDLAALVQLAFSSVAARVKREAELQGPAGEVPLEGDQAQLQQVLVVLLENALLAGARRVRVTCAPRQDEVALVVEDDGPGLPEALGARCLEPFVTGRGKEGGTGLGLAIARGIIERHRGRIAVAPPGELGGARFEIRLPRAQRVLAAATEAT